MLDHGTFKRYNISTFTDTIMSTFPTITLGDLKRKGTNALPKGQPVYLLVHSRKHSVVIPAEEYEKMIEYIETLDDMRIVERRRHEKAVPLEKLCSTSKPKRRRPFASLPHATEELPMTAMNTASPSFAFLSEEPDLYSISDLKKRYA